jgi:prevent-host-death family protein
MTKQYSIAEARHHLPSIVHEVEGGSAVELTRRGKPVAVLVSLDEYRRLRGEKQGFWDALQEWRRTVDWDEVGDIDGIFRDVRDPSLGRDFEW